MHLKMPTVTNRIAIFHVKNQNKTKRIFVNLPHCKEYEASRRGGFSAPRAAHAALVVDGVIMPGPLQASHLFCYTK